MIEKTLTELKAIASELDIVPDGDKRLKDTWIRAIHNRGITVVDPWFDKQKSPLEREKAKLPLGARVALLCEPKPEPDPPDPQPEPQPEPEEPPTEPWPFPPPQEEFIPKFHQVYIDELGIRYRYKFESYKSDWISWTGTKEELHSTLQEIEETLDGIYVYKNHKIQVTPILEIKYRPLARGWLTFPLGENEDKYRPLARGWLTFPLKENEDIQEGMYRLRKWINLVIEAQEPINKLPQSSSLIPLVVTVKITEHGIAEFRRNCVPIAVSPRPP